MQQERRITKEVFLMCPQGTWHCYITSTRAHNAQRKWLALSSRTVAFCWYIGRFRRIYDSRQYNNDITKIRICWASFHVSRLLSRETTSKLYLLARKLCKTFRCKYFANSVYFSRKSQEFNLMWWILFCFRSAI